MANQQSDPETILKLFLQRLNDKNAAGIGELFADTIDWTVPGNTALPWVGSRSNRSEVVTYFHTMWANFAEGKSSTELDSIIIKGDDVILLGEFTHTAAATGIAFQTPVAIHLVISNGKINKLQLYEDTWKVSNAFFPDLSISEM